MLPAICSWTNRPTTSGAIASRLHCMTRVGVVTFVLGAVIWFFTGAGFGPAARRPAVPWVPRFGLALGALGLAVLASTQPGASWAVSSISFSIIAIVLLVWVLLDNLRR